MLKGACVPVSPSFPRCECVEQSAADRRKLITLGFVMQSAVLAYKDMRVGH